MARYVFTHLVLVLFGAHASSGVLPQRLADVTTAVGCDRVQFTPSVIESNASNGSAANTSGNVSAADFPSNGSGVPSLGTTQEQALECLFDHLYPAPGSEEYVTGMQFDNASGASTVPTIDTTQRSELLSAFGDVLPDGTDVLVRAAAELGVEFGPKDTFVDIGSGSGRLALQVYLTTGVGTVVGMEPKEGRNRVARAAGQAALGLLGRGPTLYGVGVDRHVYAQRLDQMTAASPWILVNVGPLETVAAWGDVLYGVREDGRVYTQNISSMEMDTEWMLASRGSVQTLAFHGDYIYAAGTDQQVWRQVLSTMSPQSAWTAVGSGQVIDIAIVGDTMYAVGLQGSLWKQQLSTMRVGTSWAAASKGVVERISIHDDVVYGVASDSRIWRQNLSMMSPQTSWQPASAGNVVAVGVSPRGSVTPAKAASTTVRSTARTLSPHEPIEFVSGEILAGVQYWSNASVVHMSSLRFSTSLLLTLSSELSTRLRPGAVVFSQRRIPGCQPGLQPAPSISVPTSWSPNGSRVHVYVVAQGSAEERSVYTWPAATMQDPELQEADRKLESASDDKEDDVASDDIQVGSSSNLLSVPATGPTDGIANEVVENVSVALQTPASMDEDNVGSSDGYPQAVADASLVCAWNALVASSADAVHRTMLKDMPPAQPTALSGDGQALRGKPSAPAYAAHGGGEHDPSSPEAIALRVAAPANGDIRNRTLAWLAAAALDAVPAVRALQALVASHDSPPSRVNLVDTPDHHGLRPLGLAATRGHTEVARVLLDARASVSALQDEFGQRAIHLAALHGHTNVTQLLLGNGAHIRDLGAEGFFPDQLAPLQNKELLGLLRPQVMDSADSLDTSNSTNTSVNSTYTTGNWTNTSANSATPTAQPS